MQHELGSNTYKRSESLHKPGVEDRVIDLHKDWNKKIEVAREINPPRTETTKSRIFEAASNVDRKKQEGCMNKIKIERANKLDIEDTRGRTFNVISGATLDRNVWLNSMGTQKL